MSPQIGHDARFHVKVIYFKVPPRRTSLLIQWLGVHLLVQEICFGDLVRGDSMCHKAHDEPQLLSLYILEPVICNKRSHWNEKRAHCNDGGAPAQCK